MSHVGLDFNPPDCTLPESCSKFTGEPELESLPGAAKPRSPKLKTCPSVRPYKPEDSIPTKRRELDTAELQETCS